MKKLKLFFALFAMLALGVGNAWADDVTFSWAGSATADAGKTDYVVEQTPVTLTFAAGTAQNAPRTNKEGSVRMYANTTLTISCASGNITKVTFTPTGASYNATKLKYNGTALTSDEWTLSSPSNEVTLTATAAARFKSIVVTYTPSSGGTEPPTQAKTYDVTWMVNGEEWDTTEDVEENTQITTLPTEPTDECAGKVFQGWTDKEITDGQKPAVLFKDKSPEITKDSTIFYAVFATIPAGGGTGGSITISSETANLPTEYGTANTFTEYTLEDYKFKIQQVYKTGAKLQWRASGNKNGTGTMYNTQKFPANIASIVVVFDASDNNKNHTVKVGATENPTSGTSISPSISGVTYTFDCSGGSYDYFVLTNGANAGYISSITINYGSVATPSDYTTTCSGSTELVDSLTAK